jgi:hypothetical protein
MEQKGVEPSASAMRKLLEPTPKMTGFYYYSRGFYAST